MKTTTYMSFDEKFTILSDEELLNVEGGRNQLAYEFGVLLGQAVRYTSIFPIY